jgi:hypothetical protein
MKRRPKMRGSWVLRRAVKQMKWLTPVYQPPSAHIRRIFDLCWCSGGRRACPRRI